MQREAVLDFRELAAILRRRRLVLVVVLVGALGIAAGSSLLATPVYKSRVSLIIEPQQPSTQPDAVTSVILARQDLETQALIATSTATASAVADRLGLDADPERLASRVLPVLVEDTRVLTLTVSAPSAEEAAQLARAFAEVYLEQRRERAATQLSEASSLLRERADALRERLDELDELARSSPGRLAEVEGERSVLLAQLGELSAQQATLGELDAVVRGGGQILQEPTVPTAPAEPNPPRAIALGAVLGLAFGCSAALLRDRLDDRLRSEAHVRRVVDRPVLTRVPAWSDDAMELPMLATPASPEAESFRSLANSLRYLAGRADYRSIAVTSAISGEGKTTVASNLALALAASGRLTLLVDADMRRPDVARTFGVPNGVGLAEVLSGQAPLTDALVDVDIPNLVLVTSGAQAPNPGELLASTDVLHVLRDMQAAVDVIVWDTPPCLPVADAAALGNHVDTTLLVVSLDTSKQPDVERAVDELSAAHGRLAGIVLNRVPRRQFGAYYQYEAEA